MLINDSITNPNWGDRAAVISLKALIRATGGEIAYSVPDDDLITSSFDHHFLYLEDTPKNTTRDVVKLLLPPLVLEARRRLVKKADLTAANRVIPERWEDFEEAAKAVLRGPHPAWNDLLAGMESTDVAVIHGDGAMWGNGIIPRSDLFLTYLLKKHFGKPVIMVNHSVDLGHPALRAMAENVYPLFDDVVYRDPLSAERYKTLCGGRFAADTAFWFEPAPKADWLPVAGRPTYFDVWPDVADFDPSAPYLCVGGSSLLCTDWRPLDIARDYLALLRHFRSIYSGQIILTCSGLEELEAFRPVATELGLPLLAPTMPVQQVVDILAHSDAYVGGRWHTAIFALRGGAPVVALSAKQSKMEALMLSAHLPATAFDAFHLAERKEAIGRALLDHLEQGDALRKRIRGWADEMAANCWDNVTYLRLRSE